MWYMVTIYNPYCFVSDPFEHFSQKNALESKQMMYMAIRGKYSVRTCTNADGAAFVKQ